MASSVWVVYLDDYQYPSKVEHRIVGVAKSREQAIALARHTVEEDVAFMQLNDVTFTQTDLDADTIVFDVKRHCVGIHIRAINVAII